MAGRRIGLDLLWFIPVYAGATVYFEVGNVLSAYHNLALVYHRFTWGLLLSPAAATFFTATLASVWLPLLLLLLGTATLDPTGSFYRRRYLWAAALVLAIAASGAILQFVIWGSFPLPADDDGYIHLRMIPFVPWPATSQ
jgi:hypothetical protein